MSYLQFTLPLPATYKLTYLISNRNMRKTLTIIAAIVTMAMHAQPQKNLGADLSLLPAYEDANTTYLTSAGTKIGDVLTYMRDKASLNFVRVRLHVNPDNSNKDGVVQDLDYVTQLGKRIKDAGMAFMLDFHYSDTWADPSHQTIPASWSKGGISASAPSNAALNDTIYNYTKRCLQHLASNDAAPDYIQIGNEVSYGMLWRTDADKCYMNSSSTAWNRFTALLKRASKAVREIIPEAKIVVHIERAGNWSQCNATLTKLRNVDYDVIGLSYYPFWHGTIDNLGTTLSNLGTNFPTKEVQIVETAYYYQHFPSSDDGFSNTTTAWPATSAGQKAFIDDLTAELNKHKNVTGLYYWCAEENGSGKSSTVITHWLNRGLWNANNGRVLPALFSLKNFTNGTQTGIESTRPSECHAAACVYDTSGIRHKAPVAHGIYIQDGKKYAR